MIKARLSYFAPGRLLLVSFLFTILIGTALLSLPLARKTAIPLFDLFFTATSATCITGLFTVPISSFTFFGQCILLALIQIGGLGLMTLSFFIASLFLNLGMTSRIMAGQLLEFELWSKIKNFILTIVVITIISEAIGTVLLFFQFKKNFGTEDALFYAFFHSVSAFCNAGISTFDTNLIDYQKSIPMLVIISILMTIGGLGFIVWYELGSVIRSWFKRIRGVKSFYRLSLHSHIVLYASLSLTILGTVLFYLLEKHNVLQVLTPFQQWSNSLFMSLSARSVGFNTIPISHIKPATLFLWIPYMIIGASPGSTGSGIKTTTFIVFVATLISLMRGRRSVEMWNRTIPSNQVLKVMAIVTLAIAWIFICTFLLLITEKNIDFMSLLFETVSAFGTCGLSTGITPNLSMLGKIIIICSMIIGRIGTLTLALSLRKKPEEQYLYTYPEERIMIG